MWLRSKMYLWTNGQRARTFTSTIYEQVNCEFALMDDSVQLTLNQIYLTLQYVNIPLNYVLSLKKLLNTLTLMYHQHPDQYGRNLEAESAFNGHSWCPLKDDGKFSLQISASLAYVLVLRKALQWSRTSISISHPIPFPICLDWGHVVDLWKTGDDYRHTHWTLHKRT